MIRNTVSTLSFGRKLLHAGAKSSFEDCIQCAREIPYRMTFIEAHYKFTLKLQACELGVRAGFVG